MAHLQSFRYQCKILKIKTYPYSIRFHGPFELNKRNFQKYKNLFKSSSITTDFSST